VPRQGARGQGTSVYFRDPDGHLLEYLAMLPEAPAAEWGVLSWDEWRHRRQERAPELLHEAGVEAHYAIGPAHAADIDALPVIELAAAELLRGYAPDSVLTATTPPDTLGLAQREGRLWVARTDGIAVGFAQVDVLDSRTAHLEELDVLPDHGRRGLGTRLVEDVCRWAGSAGFESVTLTTFRDVPFNMPFYERLGLHTVPDAELSPALRRVVDNETRRGLDAWRRVVMRRPCHPIVEVYAAPADLRFVEDQIDEYNFATTGIRDARLLVTILRDGTGRIIAGLSGHTWGGVAEVRLLWVDESRRHGGVGSRLLQAAEDEARARGCGKIVLSTHSFQAPDFYKKRGYVTAGEFRDYPRGHTSVFLEKRLPI